ncbi:MAG: acetyl-CoA hydrolase/transferase C-terminal domain-containing protein [Acidimicrobiia bacterium]
MTPSQLPVATDPGAVLDLVEPGTSIIVPLANGEPVGLLDVIERAAERLERVTVRQMHALVDREYLRGTHHGRLDHVSYFLSPVTRPHFQAGTVDLVPCNFSEVPLLLRRLAGPKLVVAAASPPDRHGYVSLGTNADYTAPFIGQIPFFVEVNHRMPRTFGRNQVHLSQLAGWCETDRPLITVEPSEPDELAQRIGGLIAERVPNGATIQAGIGTIPNAVLGRLGEHHDLGVHTELLSDGLVDLIEAGVVTGVHKTRRRGKVVTTFCLGTQAVYDFLDENPVVELLPVDWVANPRYIGEDNCFVSINATTEVDLVGQCASETVAGRMWSGSGGQADFARGAMYSENGLGFVALPSTAKGGTVSRITPQLTRGSIVTTLKNTIDHVVTEFGVAELRGRSIRERAQALIAIAHPAFRDELTHQARELGLL